MDDELDQDILDQINAHDPQTFPDGAYPEPTTPHPSDEQIEHWIFDGVVDATDGCCPHGHPSWLIRLRLI